MKSMKFMFLVLGSICLVTAHGAVYKCDRTEDYDLLLALVDDSGLVFTNESGFFSNVAGEVSVAPAADGGPTIVSLATTSPTVDWSKEKGCWIIGHPDIRVTLQVSSVGDSGSTVQFFPRFVLNPNRPECSIPRVRIGPPQPINCNLLK